MGFSNPERSRPVTIPSPEAGLAAVAEENKILDAQNALLEWEMEDLKERSGIDPLTGAHRREVIKNELDRLLPMIRNEIHDQREGGESPTEASLIFIDLDKFKQVNDTFGHSTGDDVLKKVAELLKDVLRGTDILARYGGDEFVVLLPKVNEENALVVAEKLRSSLDTDSFLKDFGITASFGVCSSAVSAADDSETFIKHADEAAYFAKRSGGNRVEAYK